MFADIFGSVNRKRVEAEIAKELKFKKNETTTSKNF